MSEPRCEYCQETQHSWHACVPLVAALRARAEAAEQKYTELQDEWDKAREAYEDARATNAIVLRDLLAAQQERENMVAAYYASERKHNDTLARLEALAPVLAAARALEAHSRTAPNPTLGIMRAEVNEWHRVLAHRIHELGLALAG